MQTALPANVMQYIAVGAFALVFLGLRLARMSRSRPLKIEQLWIIPAIFAVGAAVALWQAPPSIADAPWLLVAAVLGGVVGWYRGKTMRITVDPQTHALNQSASPAALIFLIVYFALRFGLRYGLAEEAQAWHLSVSLLTDGPLLFIVGVFTLARVEVYLRAQRLLREARAAHTTTPVSS